jgi:hypothetical protein
MEPVRKHGGQINQAFPVTPALPKSKIKIKIKCEPNFFIRQDCFDLQSKPNPHANKIFNHDPLDGLTLTYKGLDLYDDKSIVPHSQVSIDRLCRFRPNSRHRAG